MEENSLELVNSGNDRKIHEKKNKHRRMSVEESVATVEEVSPKRKKKRTAQKINDNQIVNEGDNDTRTLLHGASSDPENKPKGKKKRKRIESDESTVKKGEKCKQVAVDDHNDDKLPQHQDTATLRYPHMEKPSNLSTDLHQHSSHKSSKRRKKHKQDDGDNMADGPDIVEKKRKHKETSDAPTTDTSEPKLKRKKKLSRQDTIFPDPKEDTKLNESARRALTYVHAQVSSHSDWKFNKARQNWVIRNIWDNEAIPDTYFPSCVKYLASVRGNTREILTKESKKVLDSASQTEADIAAVNMAKVSESHQGNSEAEDQRQMKITRSEMILVGLGINPRS